MGFNSYEHWKVSKLKPHRLNEKVFGELGDSADDAQFVQSIKERGIIQPIVLAADGTVVSGHRRWQGSRRAGLEEVPVVIRRDLVNEYDIDMAWFDANRDREKSVETKARWWEERTAILAKEAQRRQAHGQTAPGKSIASGKKTPSVSGESGRAASQAAKEVGMSRRTAETAASVVKVIDKAQANGDAETARKLRETLNTKSVAAAKREVERLEPKRRRTKEVTPAKLVDQLTRKHVSPLVRGIDAVAKINGGKGDAHKAANDALNSFIASIKKMREGKQ